MSDPVLLTGATGTVGSALARRLVADGHHVRALVRSVERARPLLPAPVEPVAGDVTDADSVRRAMRGARIVIHTAGLPEQWLRDDATFDAVNRGGTATMVEAALAERVDVFLYTSTIDVFASTPGVEFDESVIDPLPRPTPYERSKQAADRVVTAAVDRGLPARILHPAAVYGPAPTTTPGFNVLIERVVRGTAPALPPGRMPVVLNDDVADGHVRAMSAPPGSRFILAESSMSPVDIARAVIAAHGHGRVPFTIPPAVARALAGSGEALSRLTRRPPLLARGQLHFLLCDARPSARRAREQLGWSPRPFAEGVRLTLADLRGRGRVRA